METTAISVPPDIRFLAALGLLGVVMLTVSPGVATWIGILLVLAALTYAEVHAAGAGHSFLSDVQTAFFPQGGQSK